MCFCKDWGLLAASDLFINLPNYISADGRKNQHATSPVPHTHSCQCQSDPDSDTSSPTVTSHTLSCHRAIWQLIHTHTPRGSFAYKGGKAARKTEVGIDYKRSMSQRWVSVCNVMNPREVCGVWSNTWHSTKMFLPQALPGHRARKSSFLLHLP